MFIGQNIAAPINAVEKALGNNYMVLEEYGYVNTINFLTVDILELCQIKKLKELYFMRKLSLLLYIIYISCCISVCEGPRIVKKNDEFLDRFSI